MSRERADILVCGAGIVGLTAALALARAGWHLAVVDPGPPPGPAGTGAHALRVSTLNLAAQRVLQALDAWSGVVARRAYAFDAMQVWDSGGAGRIRFDAAALGELHLGYVAENPVLQSALSEQLTDAGVDLRFGVRASALAVDERGVRCELDDGATISVRLVIGADGHNSWVRTAAGIGVRGVDYGQTALVCNVATERTHERTAWQRFLATGPLAFLPLGSGECAVVWSAERRLAGELSALSGAEFERRLAAALEQRLGATPLRSERAAFALHGQHALRYVAARVALIGDAAHTIHPLAGQGVNLGIMDAAALAQSVRRPDPGAERGLRAYERWRRGDNRIMQAAMEGFHHLFSSEHYGLRWLRNAGLTLTDGCTPAKNFLARRALGVGGQLPALARAA